MNSEFKIIKNYRDDDLLRKDFSRLSKKVFSLDFEDWYQNGYWGDDYIPYSIIADGKIVANVSVNIIDMVREGVVRHYIQLGTVMTDEAYRNRGFIRKLMAEIEKDYSDKTQSLIDSVIELQLENKELASLRDFLLPMLMNGQIKIEDVKAS